MFVAAGAGTCADTVRSRFKNFGFSIALNCRAMSSFVHNLDNLGSEKVRWKAVVSQELEDGIRSVPRKEDFGVGGY